MKEVLHPGKILKDILLSDGWTKLEKNDENTYKYELDFDNAACQLSIEKELLMKFILCQGNINHLIAYKLGRHIKGTDMALWLKLQNDYDKYQSLKSLIQHPSVLE